MANRKTKRERKEEAKRRRLEELRRRERRVRLRKLYTWGVVAAVLGGIVAWVVIARAGSSRVKEASGKIAQTAGCQPSQDPAVEGAKPVAQHVQPPARVTYNTNPPSSGNHYGAPAQTGIHAEPVQDEQQVHNLEHGHVVIQYQQGQLPPATLTALEALVREKPDRILLAPRADMPFQAAFTAWGHLQGCAQPTDKLIDAARDFVKRFSGKGPEAGGLIPGTPIFQTPGASPSPVTSPSPLASPSASPSPTGSPSPSPSPSPTST